LLGSSLDQLIADNTSTNSGRGTSVVLARSLTERDVLETLGPDRKSSSTSRPAQKAVTSIASKNTTFLALANFESSDDIISVGGLDLKPMTCTRDPAIMVSTGCMVQRVLGSLS
jgi:hypothetical protein